MPDGGFSWENVANGTQRTGGFTDFVGQLWNNVSGTTANNQFGAAEAEKARVFSAAEAQKDRQWQEMMSNTAYQRAVADMKAAGINPAMVGGNAASTPSGASASGSAASASASGNGGVLGLIAGVAKMAIGKALMAKFFNSAQRAADNHEFVGQKIKTLAAQEAHALSASQANYAKEQNNLSSAADRFEKKHFTGAQYEEDVDFLRSLYKIKI